MSAAAAKTITKVSINFVTESSGSARYAGPHATAIEMARRKAKVLLVRAQSRRLLYVKAPLDRRTPTSVCENIRRTSIYASGPPTPPASPTFAPATSSWSSAPAGMLSSQAAGEDGREVELCPNPNDRFPTTVYLRTIRTFRSSKSPLPVCLWAR